METISNGNFYYFCSVNLIQQMMEKMKQFIIKNKLTLIGIPVGAIAGFLYWKFVGCESGACAITSSPINSTIYGMIMGGLVFSMFKKEDKPATNQEENTNE